MSNPKVAPIDIGEAKRDPEYLAHLRQGEEILQRIAEAKRDERLAGKGAPERRKAYADTRLGARDLQFLSKYPLRRTNAELRVLNETKYYEAARSQAEKSPGDPKLRDILAAQELALRAAGEALKSLDTQRALAVERLGLQTRS